jgi:hypothetical protein
MRISNPDSKPFAFLADSTFSSCGIGRSPKESEHKVTKKTKDVSYDLYRLRFLGFLLFTPSPLSASSAVKTFAFLASFGGCFTAWRGRDLRPAVGGRLRRHKSHQK